MALIPRLQASFETQLSKASLTLDRLSQLQSPLQASHLEELGALSVPHVSLFLKAKEWESKLEQASMIEYVIEARNGTPIHQTKIERLNTLKQEFRAQKHRFDQFSQNLKRLYSLKS